MLIKEEDKKTNMTYCYSCFYKGLGLHFRKEDFYVNHRCCLSSDTHGGLGVAKDPIFSLYI